MGIELIFWISFIFLYYFFRFIINFSELVKLFSGSVLEKEILNTSRGVCTISYDEGYKNKDSDRYAGNLKKEKDAAIRSNMRKLIKASRDGELDTLLEVLENGVDVNLQDTNGMTALMFAASSGNAEIADILLSYGADPEIRNDVGKKAADIARQKGYDGLAVLIDSYSRGSKVSALRSYQESA